MTQQQDRQDGSSSSLPDYSSTSPAGLPDYSGTPEGDGELSEGSRRRALVVVLSVIGSALVLLAVGALVLSQTVLRGIGGDEETVASSTASRSASGHDEYVPNEEDPSLAPPPPIVTQAPTTDCTVPEYTPAAAASPGTIRGGDLQYTIPDGWDFPWSDTSVPYLTEVGAQGRNVEGSWYSVVNLGKVDFPEDEGGYPGLEQSAVTLFQCYATTAGVITTFGENPTVTDYRSEATTVDGSQAWIVQATYHFEDSDQLSTTTASIVTSIVVETPDGPSALASDVAADHPDHVKNLEDIIASLEVVD